MAQTVNVNAALCAQPDPSREPVCSKVVCKLRPPTTPHPLFKWQTVSFNSARTSGSMKKPSDRGQQCYCNHSTYIHTHTHTHTHTFSLSLTHMHTRTHTRTHTLCTIIGQQNHSSATSTDFRILCCSSFHQSHLGSHCPCHRRSWLRCTAGCHT